jgi:hypothetical protein
LAASKYFRVAGNPLTCVLVVVGKLNDRRSADGVSGQQCVGTDLFALHMRHAAGWTVRG